MPKYVITPFAAEGTKTAIPEMVQLDGSISYPQGYPTNYERNLETDPLALPIERAKFNQLMFDITGNLQDYQIYCLPPFITAAMNNGTAFSYPLFGVCRYDDNTGLKGYISTVANNRNVPSVNGATQAGWSKILDPKNNLVFKNDLATTTVHGLMRFATNAEAAQGIINNAAVTPAQLLKETADVGDEKPWRGPFAPGGWLFMRGQELSRATYKNLYDFAVANQMITTQADWQNSRKWGLYSYGNGSTTFRLPNMQGMYLCGYEAGYHSQLGQYNDDQNRSHRHTIRHSAHANSGYASISGTRGFGEDVIHYTEYDGGSRAQPRTITVNWVVKY